MRINPGAGLHNPSLWTGELFNIILCHYFRQVVCITFCRKLACNILLALLALDERLHNMILHTLFTNVANFPVRPKSMYPQKCAGVIVAISTQTFSHRNVIRVVDVPEEFSGRVAAIRVRRRDVDFFLFICIYPH